MEGTLISFWVIYPTEMFQKSGNRLLQKDVQYIIFKNKNCEQLEYSEMRGVQALSGALIVT